MLYKKINIDLIVPADEAEVVIVGFERPARCAEREAHALRRGGIEAVDVEHRGTRKRSALAHTLVVAKLSPVLSKIARGRVRSALRAVIEMTPIDLPLDFLRTPTPLLVSKLAVQ